MLRRSPPMQTRAVCARAVAGLECGMTFLPPPTNEQYQGQLWACVPLALVALQNFVGGMVHVVLPDSGLISVAGLNLSHEGGLQMIRMAARLGATQVIYALVLALIVWRHRNFTLPFLVLAIAEKSLIGLGILLKPTGSGHMPPGIYGTVILLVLCLLALFGARRTSS